MRFLILLALLSIASARPFLESSPHLSFGEPVPIPFYIRQKNAVKEGKPLVLESIHQLDKADRLSKGVNSVVKTVKKELKDMGKIMTLSARSGESRGEKSGQNRFREAFDNQPSEVREYIQNNFRRNWRDNTFIDPAMARDLAATAAYEIQRIKEAQQNAINPPVISFVDDLFSGLGSIFTPVLPVVGGVLEGVNKVVAAARSNGPPQVVTNGVLEGVKQIVSSATGQSSYASTVTNGVLDGVKLIVMAAANAKGSDTALQPSTITNGILGGVSQIVNSAANGSPSLSQNPAPPPQSLPPPPPPPPQIMPPPPPPQPQSSIVISTGGNVVNGRK